MSDESNTRWYISNDYQLEKYIESVREIYTKKHYLTAVIKAGKQRTIQQNSALHKFFEILSNELNESGIEMLHFFKEGVDIPWTPALVKELIWRPVQEAVLDKRSTADAKTAEYNKVYEVLNRHLSQKHGIYVPWPQSETER